MRYLRKLLLLAVMAMAAMAFMASTASAQESLEVSKEPVAGADSHCAAASVANHLPATGNCTIRAVSEDPAQLFQHTGATEVLFSSCSNVFEAAFNEDGVGVIYNQVLTPEGGACGREPCDEGAGGANPHRNLAWLAQLSEPVGGSNQERLDVTFCLYAHNADPASEGTAGTNCHVTLNVRRVAHQFEVETPAIDPAGNGGAQCEGLPIELGGHWVSQANTAHPDALELNHHDD